jgi:hypothetical protein
LNQFCQQCWFKAHQKLAPLAVAMQGHGHLKLATEQHQKWISAVMGPEG